MLNNSKERPHITSYDSGYEHSLEHLIETRCLVVEADEIAQPVTQSVIDGTLKLARKAS